VQECPIGSREAKTAVGDLPQSSAESKLTNVSTVQHGLSKRGCMQWLIQREWQMKFFCLPCSSAFSRNMSKDNQPKIQSQFYNFLSHSA